MMLRFSQHCILACKEAQSIKSNFFLKIVHFLHYFFLKNLDLKQDFAYLYSNADGAFLVAAKAVATMLFNMRDIQRTTVGPPGFLTSFSRGAFFCKSRF